MNRSAKYSVPSVATALALASVALTGCAGTGSTGGPSGAGGSGSGDSTGDSSPVASRVFTDADLVKILTTANGTLNAHGVVTDLGPIATQKAIESLPDHIASLGGSISPTACGPLFTKVTKDLLTLDHADTAFSAKLVYGTTVIGATSTPKGFDTATVTKLISDDIDSLASTCSSMQMKFQLHGVTVTYALTFKKTDAKTDAGFTDGYDETLSTGSSTIHTEEIVALDGNLLIGFAGISSATTQADAQTAINAVVAAAK